MREVTLTKPGRIVFRAIKQHNGILRKHKKSLTGSRMYFRLMTPDLSPIRNFPPWMLKSLFNADILIKEGDVYKLKPDIELVDKRKKKELPV